MCTLNLVSIKLWIVVLDVVLVQWFSNIVISGGGGGGAATQASIVNFTHFKIMKGDFFIWAVWALSLVG